MKKAKYICFCMVMILAFNITGCGNKILNPNTTNTTKDELYGKITIWSEENDLKALKIAGDNFIKINPKVSIEYVEVGKDNLYNKLLEAFSSGKGLPDVITVKNDFIPMYVDKFPDGFLDVSSSISSIKSNFVESQLAQCTYKNNIYGFPWKVMPSAVLYRKDIFSKANIDVEDIKTWSDYVKAGENIVKNSAGKTFMLPIDEAGDDTFFRELLNQLNTAYYDKNSKPQFNDDKAIRAMKLIQSMDSKGIVYKNNGADNLLAAVKSSTIATIPYSCNYVSILNTSASEFKGNWGVFKLPSFEAGGNRDVSLGGYSLMVMKASKNKKLSTEFGKFTMTDEDFLKKGLEKFNILPASKAFIKSASMNISLEYFGGDKIWNVYSDIILNSNPINFNEKFSETKVNSINSQKEILINKKGIEAQLNFLQDSIAK